HLYPEVEVPAELGGGKATVIAWISARTVTCPNPACRSTMPLLNGFALSKRKGKEAWLRPEPHPHERRVAFDVVHGKGCPTGGSVGRSGVECLVCGEVTGLKYVRQEGQEGRVGSQLVCVVAVGERRRDYFRAELAPDTQVVTLPDDLPDTDLSYNPRAITAPNYGFTKHRHLFTDRQLVALTTFSDLVGEARLRCTFD
ncbi:MAG: hypothetical protein ACREA0_19430, partial [bacterium]